MTIGLTPIFLKRLPNVPAKEYEIPAKRIASCASVFAVSIFSGKPIITDTPIKPITTPITFLELTFSSGRKSPAIITAKKGTAELKIDARPASI